MRVIFRMTSLAAYEKLSGNAGESDIASLVQRGSGNEGGETVDRVGSCRLLSPYSYSRAKRSPLEKGTLAANMLGHLPLISYAG